MDKNEAGQRFSTGDKVRVKRIDEEDVLNGLTADSVGVIGEHLAVGGWLVQFPIAGIVVLGEHEMKLAEG